MGAEAHRSGSPLDGERGPGHQWLAVLPVHGQDRLARWQARRLRLGDEGHGGRQGDRGGRLAEWQDVQARGDLRLRPDLVSFALMQVGQRWARQSGRHAFFALSLPQRLPCDTFEVESVKVINVPFANGWELAFCYHSQPVARATTHRRVGTWAIWNTTTRR